MLTSINPPRVIPTREKNNSSFRFKVFLHLEPTQRIDVLRNSFMNAEYDLRPNFQTNPHPNFLPYFDFLRNPIPHFLIKYISIHRYPILCFQIQLLMCKTRRFNHFKYLNQDSDWYSSSYSNVPLRCIF